LPASLGEVSTAIMTATSAAGSTSRAN
jgi:hypothetical protein